MVGAGELERALLSTSSGNKEGLSSLWSVVESRDYGRGRRLILGTTARKGLEACLERHAGKRRIFAPNRGSRLLRH